MSDNKTGLQVWADANNTTDKEMLILLIVEGQDARKLLGHSIDTSAELPSGRDKALEALLGRGRSGRISVPKDVVNSVLGGEVVTSEFVASNELPTIIFNATGQGASVAETKIETAAEAVKTDDVSGTVDNDRVDVKQTASEKTEAPVVKAAPKKRTKYSITKVSAKEMFGSGDTIPAVRSVRSFLISAGCKAQDVALMSDDDVQKIFNDNYFGIVVEKGMLVLDKVGYEQLLDVLVANGYFVAAMDTAVSVKKMPDDT